MAPQHHAFSPARFSDAAAARVLSGNAIEWYRIAATGTKTPAANLTSDLA